MTYPHIFKLPTKFSDVEAAKDFALYISRTFKVTTGVTHQPGDEAHPYRVSVVRTVNEGVPQ